MAKELSLKDKLSAAKIQLMLDYPFIGSLLFNSSVSERKDIPTACTDGKKIWYNPDFLAPLSVMQIRFVLAHECMHMAFLHTLPLRHHNRDPELWNSAGDIVINEILIEDKIGTMVEGGLRDTILYEQGKQTTEGVYALLVNNPNYKRQNNGAAGDDEGKLHGHDQLMPPQTGESDEQISNDVKVMIAQAAQSAKMQGSISAGLKRFIDTILEAKVDWRTVLNNFVVKCKDDVRSYAKPNRRFISQGLIVPSPDGEAMDDIVIAVDCSGSIDSRMLSQFAGEIQAIASSVAPKVIHVIYFDSEVSHHDEFHKGELPDIVPHGGGGTAFSPVFKYIDENDLHPSCCVFLTDLYCWDFGDEPEYPVLWVSTEKSHKAVPFGEVTCITID